MDRKSYQREYRKKNRDKLRAGQQDWRRRNPDKLRAQSARGNKRRNKARSRACSLAYYHKHRERILAHIRDSRVRRPRVKKTPEELRAVRLTCSKRWQENNRDKVRASIRKWGRNNKDKINQQRKARRRVDPLFAVGMALRARMLQALRRDAAGKATNTLGLLGCTIPELRAHLETQFTPGMTWANRGLKGWHIDHIRPCASFDLTNPAEQRACFHYTNLQPLWAEENRVKAAKIAA